jgi:hypothetical protein
VRSHEAVSVVHEVGEQLAVARAHDGAFGDRDDKVGSGCSVTLLAGTVLARGRSPVGMVTEGKQRRDVAVGASCRRGIASLEWTGCG